MNFAPNDVDWLVSDISEDLDRHWGGKRRNIRNVSFQAIRRLGRVLKFGKKLLDEVMEEIEQGNINPSVQLRREDVRSLIDDVFRDVDAQSERVMLDSVVRRVLERVVTANAQSLGQHAPSVTESGFFRLMRSVRAALGAR